MSDIVRPNEDDVEEAVLNLYVQSSITEFGFNMGFEVAGLPRYGLEKIARRAAWAALEAALNRPEEDTP